MIQKQEILQEVYMDSFADYGFKKLSIKERAQYNASLTYSRDLHNIEAQNFAKGIEKGKIEIAINMLKEGLDINKISKFTGLSIEKIKNI
jgi:predicted transposase/invertase (TIGR01784 family)